MMLMMLMLFITDNLDDIVVDIVVVDDVDVVHNG